MRVLLVEGEDLLAEFLKRSLAKAGHDVDGVADGEVASAKLLREKYDTVILDSFISNKNGLEICHDARSANIKVPILIISSENTEAARIKGLDAGADDYMVKPFSYGELEARLRALYRRPTELVSDAILIGDVFFSAWLHCVKLNGKEVSLRVKEFALLEYLARNIGRVVPRAELYSHVWGVSAENASNRVEACIKQIRAKLGKDFIRTIHGVGYVIGKG